VASPRQSRGRGARRGGQQGTVRAARSRTRGGRASCAAEDVPRTQLGPDLDMAAMMEGYVDKIVQVVTNDGRNIIGVLKGFDQTTNVILDECHERVYSSTAGVEQVVLGLYIVRGDNIAVVGEVDEEVDAELVLDDITAEPLKPVVH